MIRIHKSKLSLIDFPFIRSFIHCLLTILISFWKKLSENLQHQLEFIDDGYVKLKRQLNQIGGFKSTHRIVASLSQCEADWMFVAPMIQVLDVWNDDCNDKTLHKKREQNISVASTNLSRWCIFDQKLIK